MTTLHSKSGYYAEFDHKRCLFAESQNIFFHSFEGGWSTLAGVEAGKTRRPLDHPELGFPPSSFHSGADNAGRRRITQQPPHLSFGRFFAGSTFLICGLPDSFSWLSALSPAVAMDVREFALRSLQRSGARVRNRRLVDSVRSDNTDGSLTGW